MLRTDYHEIAATVDTYIRIGDSGITSVPAASMLLPADTDLVLMTAGHTHISYKRVTTSGILNITPISGV